MTAGFIVAEEAVLLWRKGQDVKKGKRSLMDVGLGESVARILQALAEWCGVVPEHIPASALACLSCILGFSLRNEASCNVSQQLSSMGGKDSRMFLEALKKFSPGEYDKLYAKGYTPGLVEREGVTLLELAEALSSGGVKSYKLILDQSLVGSAVRKLLESSEKGSSLNSSIVRSYLLLIEDDLGADEKRSITEALSKGGMDNREGARILAEVDRRIRKAGVSYNYALPALTLVCLISMLRGAKPP